MAPSNPPKSSPTAIPAAQRDSASSKWPPNPKPRRPSPPCTARITPDAPSPSMSLNPAKIAPVAAAVVVAAATAAAVAAAGAGAGRGGSAGGGGGGGGGPAARSPPQKTPFSSFKTQRR